VSKALQDITLSAIERVIRQAGQVPLDDRFPAQSRVELLRRRGRQDAGIEHGIQLSHAVRQEVG
jgi:hypothetical protein